jgi:rubredoxin
MYKKNTALEIQFAPQRLNDAAGDPYWLDLSVAEARRLWRQLDAYFAVAAPAVQAVPVFALDAPDAPDASALAAAGAEVLPPADAHGARTHARAAQPGFKQWVCVICGWVYDEAAGLPEEGIAAGTRWQDIAPDWRCPLCDVGKSDFVLVEF